MSNYNILSCTKYFVKSEVDRIMEKRRLKYSKKTILSVALVAIMFVSFTFGMIVNDVVYDDVTFKEAVEQQSKSWHLLAADLDPGNGASGIVNAYIYPHSAAATYDSALVEGDAYEHFDAAFVSGEELEGETPHSTAFDIVVEYQFSDVAYNVTSADWEPTLVKAYWNESQLSVSSQLSEESADFFAVDGTSDAKINFYLLDADGGAGTGFTIGQGVQIDETQIKVYYYG